MIRDLVISLCVLWVLALVVSCSQTDEPSEGGGDTEADEETEAADVVDALEAELSEPALDNGYTIAITRSGEEPLLLERDLSSSPIAFSYGSTHIAPAVSFAVEDTIYSPRFMIVTFNFGIVIGSSDHPTQCEGAGTFDLPGGAPTMRLFLDSKDYTAEGSGAEGDLVITTHGTTPGAVMAGSVSGRLEAVGTGEMVTIEGSFRFEIPE